MGQWDSGLMGTMDDAVKASIQGSMGVADDVTKASIQGGQWFNGSV